METVPLQEMHGLDPDIPKLTRESGRVIVVPAGGRGETEKRREPAVDGQAIESP